MDVSTSSLASNFTNPSPTTSAPSTSSTATSSSGIDSTIAQPAHCNKFPGAAIAAGFFPGLFVGAVLMLLAVLFFGREASDHSRPSSTTSSFSTRKVSRMRTAKGEIVGISDPIPIVSPNSRTDFLRRTASRAKSVFSPESRYGAETSHWKMPTPPVPSNIPMGSVGRGGLGPAPVPVTPTRDDRSVTSQRSTESIRVYTPQPVVPVRGMESQRGTPQPPQATIGSPFKTPPPPGRDMLPQPGGQSAAAETLTTAMYSGGSSRRGRDDVASRPTTTFTDMLHEINFPDPLKPGAPPVPKIPKGLGQWGKR